MIALVLALMAAAPDENASKPLGDPVLEPSTLHCLGAYWIIQGDANRNAKIDVACRKAGTAEWKKALPLFRVERGAHQPEKGQSRIKVPADGWLFAGSVVQLEPDTAYELKLTLSDPDGGNAEKLLQARTIAEPVAPVDLPEVHVRPGAGALREAQREAKPGTLFLVHAGVYEGTFDVSRSGEPGRPIVWRAAGDGEAVIDAKGAGIAIAADGVHDVWFERLTVRNAVKGLAARNASRVVVRRCRFHQVEFGFYCTVNDKGEVHGFFISDNVIEGPCTWPRTKGIEDPRGIQVTGQGHVICYNRIRGFSDAIDTFPSPVCAEIDFHNNEISEMTDDGCEMDYSERNTRCFENRFTNVFQGISLQPVPGGPVYVFRNVLVNVVQEPFKLHNSPSGGLLFHNTVVKKGEPLLLLTPAKVRHCVSRNNLFVGTTGRYAYENDAPMEDCDFDYDGFAGGPWSFFMKWNGARFKTLEEVKGKASVYRHAVQLEAETLFASGLRPPEDPKLAMPVGADARLKAGSAAIDAGEPLPGFNDGFTGAAPDLGACELGAPLPHYGPRPER